MLYTNFGGGIVPIRYKRDIMDALKNAGYSSYKLRQDKILGQATMTKFRNQDASITVANLETVCALLNCQPGDILEYVPDASDAPPSGEE